MEGMTYEEKLLTRCLLLSGMHWTRVAFIVGKLQEVEITEMLERIAAYRELDQPFLYSTALEILEKRGKE